MSLCILAFPNTKYRRKSFDFAPRPPSIEIDYVIKGFWASIKIILTDLSKINMLKFSLGSVLVKGDP